MGQRASAVGLGQRRRPPPDDGDLYDAPRDPIAGLSTNASPLFIEDQMPPGADWGAETLVTYAKRLCGALPESESERRKRLQVHTSFVPGGHSIIHFAITHAPAVAPIEADAAARVIQSVLRRAAYRARWRAAVQHFVARLREQARLERARQEELETLAKFRDVLLNGFSAAKVSARGALKNIHMKLVIDDQVDECYLTWTPSVKKVPRLFVHHIDRVVAVTKTDNAGVPPHLLRHVSYRRSLVIHSHANIVSALPLRTVLQVGSSKERDLLVKGFTQFISDSIFQTFMDDSGVLRKDKRRASITYFRPAPPPVPDAHVSALERLERAETAHRRGRTSIFSAEEPQDEDDEGSTREKRAASDHSDDGTAAVHPQPPTAPHTTVGSPNQETENDKPLLHYYATRYDDLVVDDAPATVESIAHARLEHEEASLAYLFESLIR
ncbi:hypothetical protein ACHHYP_02959 [Achlya hypogyna]|uniref:Uncharacterized protein n=1 Tax=Achlya hypogyna TaxID=1202772 RepID=A0A1V9Z573_ACHHY|nr:hypothetical protein ACHHYP_02959 [Achlya hypogyna]